MLLLFIYFLCVFHQFSLFVFCILCILPKILNLFNCGSVIYSYSFFAIIIIIIIIITINIVIIIVIIIITITIIIGNLALKAIQLRYPCSSEVTSVTAYVAWVSTCSKEYRRVMRKIWRWFQETSVVPSASSTQILE